MMKRSTSSCSTSSCHLIEQRESRKKAEARGRQIRDDLEKLVEKRLTKSRQNAPIIAQQIRKMTITKIKSFCERAPLYYELGNSSSHLSSITLDGRTWNRPDPRVLYTIMRPSQPSSNATEYGDGCSQLAVFFIKDVLFRNIVDPENLKAPPFMKSRRAACAVEVMKKYAARGFRIVLLEHIPSLHYGSANHIRTCLTSLWDELKEMIGNFLPITVLLSTASTVCSNFKESNRSFVFPQPGTSTREPRILDREHQQIALAIGLPFQDLSSFGACLGNDELNS